MFRNAAEVGEKPTAKRALKKRRGAVAEVRFWLDDGIAKTAAILKKLRPLGTAPSRRGRQRRTIAT